MEGIMKRTLLFTTLIALGLTLGCAKNGQELQGNLKNAQAAIQAAQSAEAGNYAPLDLRIAEDKLSAAKNAGDDKEYDKARMLADEARINAQLAEQKAEAEKAKRATKEIRDSIEELNQAVQ